MSLVQEWKTYRYGWVWSTWHRYAHSLLLAPKHDFRQWNQIHTMLLAPALRRTGTYVPDPSVSTASTAAGTSSSSSCTRPCHSWHRTRATWWPSSLTLCTPWLAGSPFLTWAHEGPVRLPQSMQCTSQQYALADEDPGMAPCALYAGRGLCMPACGRLSAESGQQAPITSVWWCIRPIAAAAAEGLQLCCWQQAIHQGHPHGATESLSSQLVCSMHMRSLHVHRNRYSDLFGTTSSAELLMHFMQECPAA